MRDRAMTAFFEPNRLPSRLVSRTPPVLLAAALCLAAYLTIYLPYVPIGGRWMGSDYGYFLPQLLAGHLWFRNNGLFSIPMFTPAFCGGVPYYPNMQGLYLSVPQLLTFAVGPLRALQVSFALFAATGLAAFYWLLRRYFGLAGWIALAGAVVFLFNGFFAARFFVGHLTFHPFMLTPLLAIAALAYARRDGTPRFIDGWLLVGGVVVGYALQAGMVHVLPPAVLGVVIIVLVHGLYFGFSLAPFVRLAACSVLGVVLVLGKLVAALAFMRQFPRDMMPLPGFESLWDTVVIAFKSVFLAPPFHLAAESIRNNQWYPDWAPVLALHELNYGVTLVPLLVLLLWLGVRILKRSEIGSDRGWRPQSVVAIATIGALLALPIFLNWYQPAWTGILKSLPFFGNSSTMIRWFAIYTLFFAFLTPVMLEKLPLRPESRRNAALAVVLAVVGLHMVKDNSYFVHWAGYDMRYVDAAYDRVENGDWEPRVDHVEWPYISTADRMARRDRNDSLVRGGSQAECYEPMFGHRLEAFPFGPLRAGPTLEARDGLLNVKNPSCFVFPEANDCRPGDHFTVAQREEAEAFLSYRPFAFRMPWWQHAANWLNVAAALAVLLGFLYFAGNRLRRGRSGRRATQQPAST